MTTTMTKGMDQQKLAVDSGAWILFRYSPDLAAAGKNPLILDSREPKEDMKNYMYNENRFRSLRSLNPDAAETYLKRAQEDALSRYKHYKYLADKPV